MAVGSLEDLRPALREASPQRCGRGGQTTQEAVGNAAVSRQRPQRGQPRKTAAWMESTWPIAPQRPVAGAWQGRGRGVAGVWWGRGVAWQGRGRGGAWRGRGGGGAVLASLGGSLPRRSLSPVPLRGEPGSQQAAASRPQPQASGSRVQSPASRLPGLSAPSLQLPGSL